MQITLTPELILEAYRQGLFPMAYNAGSPFVHWICPDLRGQLSINNLHIPRRLIKTLRAAPYEVSVNKTFESVIGACGAAHPSRPETWINEPIRKVFCDLHARGLAHSVECWDGKELVGGVYGLELGGAFFGESMFSRATDASKIALVNLMARVWKGGFTLFDTQFINDHLKQFGAYESPFPQYKKELATALKAQPDFALPGMSQRDLLLEYLEFHARR